MRTTHLGNLFFIIVATICTAAFSQNQSPEFIESSSPLPDGGRVISRSVSGSDNIQTVTTVSSSTTRQSNRSSIDGSSNSVLESNSPRQESVYRQSIPTPTADANVGTQAAAQARYPYPASNRPTLINRPTAPTRVAQAGLIHSPIRASATCTNCQTPFQVPTLGLNNTTTSVARQNYGQGNCCSPQGYNSNYALQVNGYQAPVLQIQPPASQVPSLAIQDPGQTAPLNTGATFQQPFQTTQQTPFIGGNQFGAQRNRWIDPLISGSGAYQPVIRIANIQPGTYLGQGIIGQPTAYVDGQVVRNLLRYIFP